MSFFLFFFFLFFFLSPFFMLSAFCFSLAGTFGTFNGTKKQKDKGSRKTKHMMLTLSFLSLTFPPISDQIQSYLRRRNYYCTFQLDNLYILFYQFDLDIYQEGMGLNINMDWK